MVVHRSLDQSEGLIQTDFRKLLESERKTTRILVILVDLWFSSDSKENPLWSIWASSWRNWYGLVSNYRYLRSKTRIWHPFWEILIENAKYFWTKLKQMCKQQLFCPIALPRYSVISAVCGGILNLFENTARDVFNILDF